MLPEQLRFGGTNPYWELKEVKEPKQACLPVLGELTSETAQRARCDPEATGPTHPPSWITAEATPKHSTPLELDILIGEAPRKLQLEPQKHPYSQNILPALREFPVWGDNS